MLSRCKLMRENVQVAVPGGTFQLRPEADSSALAREEHGSRGARTTRADDDRVIHCLLTAIRVGSAVV